MRLQSTAVGIAGSSPLPTGETGALTAAQAVLSHASAPRAPTAQSTGAASSSSSSSSSSHANAMAAAAAAAAAATAAGGQAVPPNVAGLAGVGGITVEMLSEALRLSAQKAEEERARAAANAASSSLNAMRENFATLRGEHKLDDATLLALLRTPVDKMIGAPPIAKAEPSVRKHRLDAGLKNLLATACELDVFQAEERAEKEIKKLTVEQKCEQGHFVTLEAMKCYWDEHTSDKDVLARISISVADISRLLGRCAERRVRFVFDKSGGEAALGKFFCRLSMKSSSREHRHRRVLRSYGCLLAACLHLTGCAGSFSVCLVASHRTICGKKWLRREKRKGKISRVRDHRHRRVPLSYCCLPAARFFHFTSCVGSFVCLVFLIEPFAVTKTVAA